MPLANTVTVTAGSTFVDGYLTSFVAAEGDLLIVGGLTAAIESQESTTRLILKQPWPGATATDQAFVILPVGQYWRSPVTTNRLVTDLLTKIEDTFDPAKYPKLAANLADLASPIAALGNLVKRPSLGDIRQTALATGALTVAMEGDSLTEGYQVDGTLTACLNSGATQCSPVTIPESLRDGLQYFFNAGFSPVTVTVANRGVSGQTAPQGLVRWESAPVTQIACWMYGYNDTNSVSVADYKAALRTWIERKIKAGTYPVVLGAPNGWAPAFNAKLRDYVEAARDVAMTYGVMYVDMDEIARSVAARWQSDSVHPSEAARRAMGWGLAAALTEQAGLTVRRVNDGSLFYPEDNLGIGGSYYPSASAPTGNFLRVTAGNFYCVAVYCEEDVYPVFTTFNGSPGTPRNFGVYFEGAGASVIVNDATGGVFRKRQRGPLLKRGYRTFMLQAAENEAFLESIAFESARASESAISGKSGWVKHPDGRMEQWGTYTQPATPSADPVIAFPVPFPVACDQVIPVAEANLGTGFLVNVFVNPPTVNNFTAHIRTQQGATTSGGTAYGFSWRAYGRWK